MANRDFSAPQTPSAASPSDWTRSFQTGNPRRPGGLAIWTLTACALLFPVALAGRTEAESSTPPVVLPAQSIPTIPASDSQASSVSSPVAQAKPAPIAPEPITALVPLTAVIAGQTQKAHILMADDMNVGQALAAMNVTLRQLDRVLPEASEPFVPGMTIRVTRVTIETKTRREPIAAGVRYQPTTSLPVGTSATTRNPRAGYTEITEKVYTRDGEVTLRKTVSSKVGREPQHRIISMGTAARFMPSAIAPHKRYARALSYRGGGPRDRIAYSNGIPGVGPQLRVTKTLKMETTAYHGSEAGGGGPRTATGMRVGVGAIAVDPRVVPLGSMLYVEGYGFGFACDTGGAIKGNKLDLAFPSVSACNRYGRKRGVTVYVLAE